MSIADPNVDYYHINRTVPWSTWPKLNVDDQIEVGDQSNPYFRFFETQKMAYDVTQPDGSNVQFSGVRFLEAVKDKEVTSPNLPKIAHGLAKHLVAFIRELIWEQVRTREFPHLPSRQRCIWLIPTLGGVKFWLERMGMPTDYQILRVRVQGRIHKASELFLLGDSEPLEETIRKARRYWLGVVDNPNTEEIIFEGRVRVLEIVPPGAVQ
jgi:hypothetical protein